MDSKSPVKTLLKILLAPFVPFAPFASSVSFASVVQVVSAACALLALASCSRGGVADDNGDVPTASLVLNVSVVPGDADTETSATVEPSDADAQYYAAFWPAESLSESLSETLSDTASSSSSSSSSVASSAAAAAALQQLIFHAPDFARSLYRGTQTLCGRLEAGEWCLVTMGYDGAAVTLEPRMHPFTVAGAEPSGLALTVDRITASSLVVTAFSQDPDATYLLACDTKAAFDSCASSAEFMAADVACWLERAAAEGLPDLSDWLAVGSVSRELEVPAATELVVYAYYCDAAGRTTGGFVKRFVATPPDDSPAQRPEILPTFAFVDGDRYDPLYAGRAVLEIDVVPNAATAHFYCAVVDPDEAAKYADEGLTAFLLADDPAYGVCRDEEYMAFGPFAWGAACCFIGVAVDGLGEPGTLCRVELVARTDTPDPVAPTLDPVFEILRAADFDPDLADCGVLYVRLNPSDNAVHTYSCLLTPEETAGVPDAVLTGMLLAGEMPQTLVDAPGKVEAWTVGWGRTVVHVSVATDRSGAPGALSRHTVVITPPEEQPDPSPGAGYADFLGYWTLSGVDETGTVRTHELKIEPDETGRSYSVYGVTNSAFDVYYNAPLVWGFADGRLRIEAQNDLFYYDGLPAGSVCFYGMGAAPGGGWRLLPMTIAEGSIAPDGRSIDLNFKSYSIDGEIVDLESWVMGFFDDNGVMFNMFSADYRLTGLTLRRAEPVADAAFRSYTGDWSLCGQDPYGNAVARRIRIGEWWPNRYLDVEGWDASPLPFRMTYHPDDGSASIRRQTLGDATVRFDDGSFGSGSIRLLGLLRYQGQYVASGQTGDAVMTVGRTDDVLTFTGATWTGEYDYVGMRLVLMTSDDAGRYLDGGSWPLLPFVAARTDGADLAGASSAGASLARVSSAGAFSAGTGGSGAAAASAGTFSAEASLAGFAGASLAGSAGSAGFAGSGGMRGGATKCLAAVPAAKSACRPVSSIAAEAAAEAATAPAGIGVLRRGGEVDLHACKLTVRPIAALPDGTCNQTSKRLFLRK